MNVINFRYDKFAMELCTLHICKGIAAGGAVKGGGRKSPSNGRI